MASIEQNRKLWDDEYNWLNHGEEWSKGWGSSDMLWFGTLMPRIKKFMPTNSMLEIAPGHGRWTKYLINYCKDLSIVDLSENCIRICKDRFKDYNHIHYHVNDGKSLDMINDDSIDFVFSFDSLVHAECDVIDSYLASLRKKLRPTGVGFIHHSNLMEYSNYFNVIRSIPRGIGVLRKLGIVDGNEHMRSRSVSAEVFEQLCNKNGLRCLSQEKINWSSKRLIDCLTVFCKEESPIVRSNITWRNPGFMNEMRYLHDLSSLYGYDSNNESASI